MGSRFDRVVQVVRIEEAAGTGTSCVPFFAATGFLLTGDLAITAGHAVRDGSVRFEVRGGPFPVSSGRTTPLARVRQVVPCADRDLALLILDADPALLPPVCVAELPLDIGQIEVQAVGFPRFALEDAQPRSHQLNGTVQLASDRTGHRLQLALRDSDPPAAESGDGSSWSGFSGAGILTVREGLLAGIVTSHRPAGDRRNLTGTDLHDLRDAEFRRVLTAHGVETDPVPARLVRDPVRSASHWLPPSVRVVLARQREAADELPYRFRQDRVLPRLTAVHIRQALSPSASRPGEDPAEPQDGRAPHPAAPAGWPRRLEDVLHEVLAPGDGGHLLVTAGPGAGKSTLLHMCALDLGRTAIDAPTARDALVPLWVTGARIADAGHSLESAVAVATGLDQGDGTLPRLPRGARWLVLIDALDEVHHDQRSRLVHRLADQARNGTEFPLHMLLTTRPDPSAARELASAGFHAYALDPFDRNRLEEFARSWFKGSGRDAFAEDFLRQIDDTSLSDVLRNPLLATITAIVYEDAPHCPLPDNTWALYEQFRLHLRTARHDQFDRVWRELGRRAEAVPYGRYAVAYLRKHVDELLSHLAYAQVVKGNRDLPTAALRWWQETAIDEHGRRFGAAAPLDGWSTAVTDVLLVTGLLIRSPDGLEFLHTTFAEHLVAERLAAELPDHLDIDDVGWRTTLLAASGRTGHPHWNLYCTALAHYSHRYPESGRALLDWLQRGAYGNQLLAGALLAARCPAEDTHYRRFLDVLAERGGFDKHIWDLLTRMRHPLVTAHLHDVARDGGATDRVHAARVLVAHDADGAADLLPRLAGLPEVSGWDLLQVAVTLRESHPEHTARASESLLAIAGCRWADEGVRLAAGAALGECGGEYTEQAAEVFRAIADDRAVDQFRRGEALNRLTDLGDDYAEEAAARLVRWARDPSLRGYKRSAELQLIGLGGRHVETVAELQRTVLGDPSATDTEWRTAAVQLAHLGGAYVEEAVAVLCAVVADTRVGAERRWAAADALRSCGSEEQGAWAWRVLLDDSAVPFGEWMQAAYSLVYLGGEYAAEAERRVRALVETDELDWDQWYEVEAFLAVFAEVDPAARLVALRRQMYDRGELPDERYGAAEEMIRLGGADQVVGWLCAEFCGRHRLSSVYDYVRVIEKLTEEQRATVVQALRDRLAADRIGQWFRDLDAAHVLLRLGALRPTEDFVVLLALAVEESQTWGGTEPILRTLRAERQEDHVETVLHILTHRRTDPYRRQRVAEVLRELGDEYLVPVVASLRADLTRTSAAPRTRRAAARGLLALGGEYLPVDTEVLRDLVTDRKSSAEHRLRAVHALLCLGVRLPHRTVRALHSMAERKA
ncbi:NACHT domain-containing protein [Streptomyces sp. Marseille-Q5077]|uniref:NACHT domain-containing protein n=1 Tax=Streptomyces sp. Marseille-Q5077 TaxID=3418995 RepID=UPI003D08B415